jgi:hypothetical protein
MCGAKIVHFKNTENGTDLLKNFKCELIICPYCSKIRGYKNQVKYKEVINYLSDNKKLLYGYSFKFITLTYKKYDNTGFIDRIKTSQKDIKNFYRRLKYQYSGVGMIASMEISPNYLLHYHIIAYIPFIDQKELSDLWLDITGDSSIVYIKRIENLDETFQEVLKYATKLNKKLLNNDNDLLVMIQGALKGSRRILVYGIFYAKIKFIIHKLKEYIKILMNGVKLKYIGFNYLIVAKGVFFLLL